MEIIQRTSKVKRIEIDESLTMFQASYNSDGHLMIRLYDLENPNKDLIIVFTAAQSRELMRFIKNAVNIW